MKGLLIGDPHAEPGVSNRRFEALGRFIVEEQPDFIVNIGDMYDLPSLSSYDKGKKAFEGRRYKTDIEVGNDAWYCIERPIIAYNRKQAKNKEKQYKPRKIYCLGNHEYRINRVIESNPEFDGHIGLDDVRSVPQELGWEVKEFLEVVVIEGTAYSHYFGRIDSGRPDQPQSSVTPAYSLVSKTHMSSIAGHQHCRDFHHKMRADGSPILGLIAGCFLDPDQRMEYAKNANESWWKGIVMLNNVSNGFYNPHFIGIEEILNG